jgi:hypothetical protein
MLTRPQPSIARDGSRETLGAAVKSEGAYGPQKADGLHSEEWIGAAERKLGLLRHAPLGKVSVTSVWVNQPGVSGKANLKTGGVMATRRSAHTRATERGAVRGVSSLKLSDQIH